MQQYFEQFMGEQRRLERKFFFSISESKLLRFDCVNLLSLQEQSRAQFRSIYVLDISNFVSSSHTLMSYLSLCTFYSHSISFFIFFLFIRLRRDARKGRKRKIQNENTCLERKYRTSNPWLPYLTLKTARPHTDR